MSRPRPELHLDPLAVQVAVSAQDAIECALLQLAAGARELAGAQHLCLAGGVALNCKANGLLGGPVYAPRAPHDAGTALGAAWHVTPSRCAAPAGRISAFLGPVPGASVNGELDGLHRQALSLETVCDALQAGCIGAIMQGAGEIGPRALGHRSIVADPSDATMHGRLNGVKGREPWRPFGAAALAPRGAALAAATALDGLHAGRPAGLGPRR